ncbi:MAG: hypothetical protein DRH57_07075 [Candidatus Cloacimonadota bacterium]|nr:MAG: hypothetical protein DRH57_07075 [Candidatus Cloacimonadota bacterium]
MIVRIKPKVPVNLKKLFDKLIQVTDQNLPMHYKFLKNLTPELRELFMSYFSFIYKYDLREYDLLKRKFKTNERMLLDGILSIIVDFKDNEVWKNNQLKLVRGIYLGQLYQIQYRNYKHDPFPLAIFLNSYDSTHQNFQAINLHYFDRSFREYFIKTILRINNPRIKSGKPPILSSQMVTKLIPQLSMAYRNYKAEEIKVVEKISHRRWVSYLSIDKRTIIV